MASTTPTRSTEPTSEVSGYQPVAGLAIAAVAVAVIFALLLLSTIAAVFYTGKPALMSWLLALAILGIGLALAAHWQITRSEGTRVGRPLATFALRVCLIGGLCYGAYLFTHERFVYGQAVDFAQKWLDQLKAGKITDAFVLAIPAAERQGVNPDDLKSLELRYGPQLAAFRGAELLRLASRANGQFEAEFKSLRGWEFTGGSYLVNLTWEVRTPEGRFEVALPLTGAEIPGVLGRQWHVRPNLESMVAKRELSPTGQLLAELHVSGERFLKNWLRRFSMRQQGYAYLETQPLAVRKSIGERAEAIYTLSACLASPEWTGGPNMGSFTGLVTMLESEPIRELIIPGYKEFISGSLFTGRLDIPARTSTIREALRNGQIGVMQPKGPGQDIPTVFSVSKELVQISQPIEIDPPFGFNIPGDVKAVLESSDILAELRTSWDTDWPKPRVSLDTKRSLLAGKVLGWRVIEVELKQPMQTAQPPGGAPPPGPRG